MNGTQYHILLIITDGAISDMPATKNAIVEVIKCIFFIQSLFRSFQKLLYSYYSTFVNFKIIFRQK